MSGDGQSASCLPKKIQVDTYRFQGIQLVQQAALEDFGSGTAPELFHSGKVNRAPVKALQELLHIRERLIFQFLVRRSRIFQQSASCP